MNRVIYLLVFLVCLTSCFSNKSQPVVTTTKIKTFDQQLNSLTEQIINGMDEEGKKKIAIIEFSNLDGEITEFGKYLAEELVTRLFMTNRFDVVERQMLNKVLDEQKLGISGIIDEDSAISIGKILGVDAIVTGSITDLGTTLKINTRLISTETGSLFSVASVNLYKEYSVRKLLGNSSNSNITEGSNDEISKPDQQFSNKLVKEDIEFEMIGCEMTDRRVSFTMKITNTKEDDVELRVQYGNPKTRIFNESGEEFGISKAHLANTEMKFYNNGSLYQSIKKTLVADIPITAQFHFDNVSSKTKEISLLEINCGKLGVIEFRDLELVK